MAKELINLNWIEGLLPKDHLRKPMFGGFAYYYENRLVLTLFENPGERLFKQKTYNFDLWNGCMFPVEREFHAQILKKFHFLINHPVLPKWLYLPLDSENFEYHVEEILKEIRKRNQNFGVIPKPKKKKSAGRKNEAIDTRKPRMFADEPARERIKKALKISDLKNLGPVTEKAFTKAGIKSVQQFVKLGWKASMKKLAKSNSKNRHALFAYALIGALKNQDWNKITENDKVEARAYMKQLREKKK